MQLIMSRMGGILQLNSPKTKSRKIHREHIIPTNEKGNIGESKILAAFIEAGFIVSVPFGNGAPYDLIVDTGTQRLRVQVKSGRLRNGCVLFPTQRINGHDGTKRFKYEENSFDLICSLLSGELRDLYFSASGRAYRR